MAEKEHPARVAGRFVRAAGLAIQRELDKVTAESAQPAQTTQPTQPVQQPAAPAPAARTRRKGKPPPPPKPVLDRAIWNCFLVALLALVLTGLQIQMLAPSDSIESITRLVLGIPLLVGALLLLTNWGRANERVTYRLLRRVWKIDTADGRGARFAREMMRSCVALLGIVMFALAGFQILSAFV